MLRSKLCAAVVFVLLAVPAVARSQAFESISLKTSASINPREMQMRISANGDLETSALHVAFLLGYAYDLPMNPTPRLNAHPGLRGLYDIRAKAPANAVPANLPDREKKERIQKMIRALLADHFKLVMRVEQKTMPVYALIVASGGPNLQKSPIAERDCFLDKTSPESCHNFLNDRGHPLNAKAIDMDDLALHIETWSDLPVVNRTALNGLFAVQAGGWKPLQLPPRPPGFPQAPNFDDLPSIFTVVGKLGLELKKQEAAVPVYTIQNVEPPAAAR